MEAPLQPHLDHLLDCYPAERSTAVASQFVHRLNICKAWGIDKGCCHFLDIGCGQGECSLVLAEALGPKGHVTGADTAPPDYGGPYTLGQSQEYILSSKLGPCITFRRDEVESILGLAVDDRNGQGSGVQTHHVSLLPNSKMPFFDAAVLCHSLWYFESADAIRRIFASLFAARVPRIYLAEWKGEASTVAQEPHSLAVRAQAFLHSLKPRDRPLRVFEPNVRAVFSPPELLQVADQEGWRIVRRGTVPSPKEMLDGHWEAQYVVSDAFKQARKEETISEDAAEKLDMYIEMVKHATEVVERSSFKRVASMDVAWAVLARRD